MDKKDKEGRTDRRSGHRPAYSGSIGELQPAAARDPAFDCCCNDHCNGIVGSDHCNASTATYLDPARIRDGNLSCDRLACYVDRNTYRDSGANRDGHCCGDPADCADPDCGDCATAHGPPRR